MFILYQVLFMNRMEKEFDLVAIMEDTMEQPYDEISIFVKETAVKVVSHYAEIRAEIEPNCRTWKFDRINLIVIAILMLAIGEYRYVGDIDRNVVIDTAVKLTKKYADEKDYKFVNALLDRVL